jgi:thiamine biosynthesis protein ThiS
MKLILNGNTSEFKGVRTVSELLKDLNIEPLRVAVEVNFEIVKKPEYALKELKEGDTVEIVNFVGGG